ncbi:tumor necrosis factor receptor superfamily member 9 isoform X1 [Tamandua tetradactyla]|uniref:tumor necrosis factor receptor superfamily member 9 isoform X1 n=1 Tax=Tamandua tetradactyla TaxID=48850 RepID=UPI004053CC23
MQEFTMVNAYYNVVATVLLVVNFERTRSMLDSCSNCPAGTFCGKSKSQLCIPCPPSSFSNTGGQVACSICRRCEGVFRTKKACSPTSNAECECVPGFHCLRAGCTMCERDCKQGQQLTKEGCKGCSFGTFNDQIHGICRPWTDCSSDGRSVLVNGTQERDVVCGPASSEFPPATPSSTVPAPVRGPGSSSGHTACWLALTLAAVLCLLVSVVLHFSVAKRSREKLLYILKQPFIKPVQTVQEEDSCSCRFPEEEEGDCQL